MKNSVSETLKEIAPDLDESVISIANEAVSYYFEGEIWGGVDEYGNPVERTKRTHPYSYDGFVMWRGGENKEANATIYSDRLYSQDWERHNELCLKHFGDEGQYWNYRKPKKIEAFLRDWTGKDALKLILIMEYCNRSNGYPCWRFDFAI